MQYLLVLLTFCFALPCFARVDNKKLLQAIIQSHTEPRSEKNFYLKPPEAPELLAILEKANAEWGEEQYGYVMALKDLPNGTKFTIYQFNLLGLDNPPAYLEGQIDQNGEAWARNLLNKGRKRMRLENYLCLPGGLSPGEPIYHLAVLGDKKTYIVTHVIPKPLETVDADGHRISIELLSARSPLLLLRGENFTPDESVDVRIYFFEKNNLAAVCTKTACPSSEGTFYALLEGEPSRIIDEGGFVEVQLKDSLEPMTLKFNWNFLNNPGNFKKNHHTDESSRPG